VSAAGARFSFLSKGRRATTFVETPKKVATCISFLDFFLGFVYRIFERVATKGVEKHGKKLYIKKSIRAHYKKCGLFSPPFFLFSFGYFGQFFLISGSGHFVLARRTRGSLTVRSVMGFT
jgi:hypothetical protein